MKSLIGGFFSSRRVTLEEIIGLLGTEHTLPASPVCSLWQCEGQAPIIFHAKDRVSKAARENNKEKREWLFAYTLGLSLVEQKQRIAKISRGSMHFWQSLKLPFWDSEDSAVQRVLRAKSEPGYRLIDMRPRITGVTPEVRAEMIADFSRLGMFPAHPHTVSEILISGYLLHQKWYMKTAFHSGHLFAEGDWHLRLGYNDEN